MKVALCISGMPRHFEECYESIKENIIDLYNPDIFLDIWDDQILDDINYTNTQEGIAKIKDKINLNNIYNLYKPKKYHVEPYNKNMHSYFVENVYNLNGLGKKNSRFYSSYYKIFLCKNLKSSYEQMFNFKYDVCLRLRTDCFILNKFMLPNLIKNDEVFMPIFASQNGVNDQIWYSNSETYDKICDMFLNIKNLALYLDNSPEAILKIYLHFLNININLTSEEINNFIIYKYIKYIFNQKFSGKRYILEKYKNFNII